MPRYGSDFARWKNNKLHVACQMKLVHFELYIKTEIGKISWVLHAGTGETRSQPEIPTERLSTSYGTPRIEF
jgi:hypothetical protein